MYRELLKVSKFDATDYLKHEADMQEYLDEVSSENDPQAFLQAIKTIARAKGMAKLSRDTGITRESYISPIHKGEPPGFIPYGK